LILLSEEEDWVSDRIVGVKLTLSEVENRERRLLIFLNNRLLNTLSDLLNFYLMLMSHHPRRLCSILVHRCSLFSCQRPLPLAVDMFTFLGISEELRHSLVCDILDCTYVFEEVPLVSELFCRSLFDQQFLFRIPWLCRLDASLLLMAFELLRTAH
jgi:hypothetical protein